ncbi:glutaminyl-peptide cyclotransferase isoform X1 [Quercus robur]|uniref:glutaminyl-peptide cyclotransferase isoform X1 n=2 Tax=Quercus robur TaxID=38942 RepID=UPI002163F8B3|nr:glutaminyl-peptide cyclotransferase isoform X1 [Quercus robur]
MKSGSNKKKLNKRSNLKPQSPTSPMDSSCPKIPPSSSPSRYGSACLIVSGVLTLSSIILLGLTSEIWDTYKSPQDDPFPRIYTIEVLNEFPHDPDAFTQGLLYAGNDTLYESTGLLKKSSVRKVALQTGKVEVLQKMDDSYFGEGLTLLDERLFQVTWLKDTGFIYDRNNLSKFEKFTHQMKDGWGLATDENVLFGSDGTSTLYLINHQNFKVIGKHIVTYNGREVNNLNELEYINGEVWANVWQTDCIARISPKDGTLLGWVLLQNLRENLVRAGNNGIDVLNGIAWDCAKKRIFVTGKLWPKLYEIKLHQVNETVKSGIIEQLCLRELAFFTKS